MDRMTMITIKSRELQVQQQQLDPQLEEVTCFAQQLQSELHQSRLQLHHMYMDNRQQKMQLETIYRDCENLKQTLVDALNRVKDLEREAHQTHLLRAKVFALETRISHIRSEKDNCHCTLKNNNKVLSTSLDSHLSTKKWTVVEFSDFLNTSNSQNDVTMKDSSHHELPPSVPPKIMITPAGAPSPEVTPGKNGFHPVHSSDLMLHKLQQQVKTLTQEKNELLQDREKVTRQLRYKEMECMERDGELQSTETERVRLSLIEDKMRDVVSILQGMMKKRVASYIVGTYLTDILDEMSTDEPWEESVVDGFVQRFHQKLCKSTLLPCLSYNEYNC